MTDNELAAIEQMPIQYAQLYDATCRSSTPPTGYEAQQADRTMGNIEHNSVHAIPVLVAEIKRLRAIIKGNG